MRTFEYESALRATAASMLLVLCLAGCTMSGQDIAGRPEPAPEPRTGAAPDGAPSTEPLEPAAEAAVSAMAESTADWTANWDAAGCTGARAAADERECQQLLMDLATNAGGAAEVLAGHAVGVPSLAEAATRAAAVSDAAAEWLGAWCGGFEDEACAAPGEALAEAGRGLAASLDPWLDHGAPAT